MTGYGLEDRQQGSSLGYNALRIGCCQEGQTRVSRDPQDVTRLLQQWRGGNRQALDELTPIVYNELRRLASYCLQRERSGHTLQATALVHEAYMRLVGAEIEWQNRAHFYAVAARVLRRVLVEYARAHSRQKRGGGEALIPLDEALEVGPEATSTVLELDDALERLGALDSRKSEVLQLLFFGGLTYDETAAALDISPATVHRELKLAKAWLHRELSPNRT
jgi:RNA polymerase sigma-70 factor (ECF subfamily)